MNIVLVITAIVLTVIMFYVLKWSMITAVGSFENAGPILLIFLAILGLATLSFSAILIVAIFKCQSLVSLFVVWGVTIFTYSIYPIAVAIENAHNEAIEDLQAEFYRKAKDSSTSWEELKSVTDMIERNAIKNSKLTWFVMSNKIGIVFELLNHKRFDFVDKMIEEGHDITVFNMAEYLSYAYDRSGNKNSVSLLNQIEYLLSRGCDINAVDWNRNSLHITLNNRDEQSAQYLLDKGVDLSKPEEQTSPVAIAAKMNNISMVKQLLAKGLDIKTGELLTYCASSANKDVIELLLDNGADVNEVGYRGETALMIALQYNDIEVVELLLDRGADPNILDDDGYDAISNTIISNPDRGRVELLIKSGAVLNRTYSNGKTLKEIAKSTSIFLP